MNWQNRRVFSLAVVMTMLLVGIFAIPATGAKQAPLLGTESADVIAGSYIVVLRDNPADIDRNLAQSKVDALINRYVVPTGGRVLQTYDSALVGFAAVLSDAAVDSLRFDRNVAYIEADMKMYYDGDQANPPWGLDRVDQANLPLDNNYHYDYSGAGVNAYVIDSGLRATHNDFTGRVAGGYAAAGATWSVDCIGHGTHVTGSLAGTTHGVAKDATIYMIRVGTCSPFLNISDIVDGIDWVTANAVLPAVANMSLGGGTNNALDNATDALIASGVATVVAAGNSNANACNFSPARVPEAITVGSTDIDDGRSSFSNRGNCLDLFAPGGNILSAWNTGDNATETISGTSMASPHVAGAAALYLEANPGASPAAVHAAIVGNATPGVVSNPGNGSPNLMLNTLFGPPMGSLDVTMTPTSSTTVDSCGGVVSYTLEFSNTTGAAVSGDVWVYATGSAGQTYGPLAGPVAVTIADGQTQTYNLNQLVPGRIPAGTYTMIGAFGTSFPTADAMDSFDITKTTSPCRAGEARVSDWASTGLE